MTTYKPKTTSILVNIILVVLFSILAVFAIGKNKNILALTVVIVGYYLGSIIFSKKRVLTITVCEKEKSIVLIYRQFLIIKKKEIYSFGNIKCSYQKEVGPRGIKRKEFRLYHVDNTLIIKIIPGFMGWSNNDMEKIYGSLKVYF